MQDICYFLGPMIIKIHQIENRFTNWFHKDEIVYKNEYNNLILHYILQFITTPT